MGVLQKAKKGVENFVESTSKKSDYVLDDKNERTENCFNTLKTNNIEICFKDSGIKITEFSQLQDIGVGRIDMIDNIIEYCLNELVKHDVVRCEYVCDA